jgi:hypothetical protein
VVSNLDILPDLKFPIAVAENESLLGMFSTAPGKEIGTLQGHHALVRSILDGRPVTYIGIPGANLTSFNMEFPIAVSSDSAGLDGAKQFLDSLWKLSFASFGGGDLRMVPLKRSELEKAVKSYGDKSKSGMSQQGFDKDTIEDTVIYLDGFKPYSKSDYTEFLNLTDGAALKIDAPAGQYGDDALFDIHHIIAEEIRAFFAGTQDAKRTAELIQSRYSIYLAEQK